MNKRVKIVVKGILVCLVFLAVVLVADKEISANRISDLEASIQEKEAEIDAAVQSVYDALWQDGGCIAQCEFGPAGNPQNVYRVYEKWNEMR